MKKEQKTAVVDQLSDRFKRAKIALVSEYRGLTVAESTEVRRKLRAVRGELKVAKNTLVRRAIKDTPFAPLDGQLIGPVGLIIGLEDPVEVAKTVVGLRDLETSSSSGAGWLTARRSAPKRCRRWRRCRRVK